MKQIIVKRCCSCPYMKIQKAKKPDNSGYHEIVYCTHKSFCEDEGSHMSCDNMLIDVSEQYGQAFENLFNIPDWCPLEDLN